MIEEHSLGVCQFSVIEKTSFENEAWDTKFSVLKEGLEYHMEEEEEELITIARKVLSKEKLLEGFESVLDKIEERERS